MSLTHPQENEVETPAPWLPLLQRLTDRFPTWTIWKNADAGLRGDGDIDSAAPRSDWNAIAEEFGTWAAASGLGRVVACTHPPETMFLTALSPNRSTFVELDVSGRKYFRGGTLFRATELAELSEIDARGFRRLRPGAEALILLVTNGMRWGGRPDPDGLDRKDVASFLAVDPDGVVAAARRFRLPVAAVARLAVAVKDGRWDRLSAITIEMRGIAHALGEPSILFRRIWFRAVTKKRCPLLKSVFYQDRRIDGDGEEWARRMAAAHAHRPVVATRGMSIAIGGPDGVGKTTLVDALAQDGNGCPIVALDRVSFLPRRTPLGIAVPEPHAEPSYGKAASLLKTAYIFVDFLLGWAFRVRPLVRRGRWVFIQRGWWDHAVDPMRYRLDVSPRLLAFLGRLVPRANLMVVLEAPASTIKARKEELPAEEIERQRGAWRKLVPPQQRAAFIDASVPAEDVVRSVRSEIERVERAR
jgi:thymidylate kinase